MISGLTFLKIPGLGVALLAHWPRCRPRSCNIAWPRHPAFEARNVL